SGLSAGTYSGTLTVSSNGGTKTVTVTMQVATQDPVAKFSMSSGAQTAIENQTLNLTVATGGTASVNFSATTSYDPDGTITGYQWKINGTPVSNSQSFTFVLAAGTHQIFLTVTDNHGLTDPVGATVVVTESPPTAIILGYGPSSVVHVGVGESVSLSVTFLNNGNVPWKFIAGATVWNSSGQQVANYSTTIGFDLQPQQQYTVNWSHTVGVVGDFWIQFGVWRDSITLLYKEPSPSQLLIVGQKFSLNARVRTTANLNVRTGPGTSYPEISGNGYPGYAPSGTAGTVISGPTSSDGFVWWRVQFDAGYTGWCADNWLEKL
ncbi:MAG: hypothetical protein IIA92_01440, partial [Chloroflexi bacterium]|nr:hypothetical protein [Chloroflexota bacterium]